MPTPTLMGLIRHEARGVWPRRRYMELETALFGNTLLELLSALGVALAIILVALVIKRVVIRRIAVVAQRTSTRFDDALIKALG